jgi:UDP-N-acetylmuramate dehydrogenase
MSTTSHSIIKSDVNLQPYNTLQIPATAHRFAEVTSTSQLQTILEEVSPENKPLLVLGGGSNILFADDFEGTILHIKIAGKKNIKENDNHVWLEIGAGENWHETVRYCVEQGWGGIENLSLIPGTVGAAPIQNIGAYGVELEEVFEQLEAVHLESGEKHIFLNDDCKFGYRDSIFKNELKGQYAVTTVVLKLSKVPDINSSYGAIQSELDERGITEPDISDISDIVVDIRNSKLPDPQKLGNAGSFFKNPIVDDELYQRILEEYPNAPGYSMGAGRTKVPAGWLIEEAGWKGKVVGNVGTYRQQALVIVNHGGATGREILSLADNIQASVKDKFGIALVPEVNIIA